MGLAELVTSSVPFWQMRLVACGVLVMAGAAGLDAWRRGRGRRAGLTVTDLVGLLARVGFFFLYLLDLREQVFLCREGGFSLFDERSVVAVLGPFVFVYPVLAGAHYFLAPDERTTRRVFWFDLVATGWGVGVLARGMGRLLPTGSLLGAQALFLMSVALLLVLAVRRTLASGRAGYALLAAVAWLAGFAGVLVDPERGIFFVPFLATVLVFSVMRGGRRLLGRLRNERARTGACAGVVCLAALLMNPFYDLVGVPGLPGPREGRLQFFNRPPPYRELTAAEAKGRVREFAPAAAELVLLPRYEPPAPYTIRTADGRWSFQVEAYSGRVTNMRRDLPGPEGPLGPSLSAEEAAARADEFLAAHGICLDPAVYVARVSREERGYLFTREEVWPGGQRGAGMVSIVVDGERGEIREFWQSLPALEEYPDAIPLERARESIREFRGGEALEVRLTDVGWSWGRLVLSFSTPDRSLTFGVDGRTGRVVEFHDHRSSPTGGPVGPGLVSRREALAAAVAFVRKCDPGFAPGEYRLFSYPRRETPGGYGFRWTTVRRLGPARVEWPDMCEVQLDAGGRVYRYRRHQVDVPLTAKVRVGCQEAVAISRQRGSFWNVRRAEARPGVYYDESGGARPCWDVRIVRYRTLDGTAGTEWVILDMEDGKVWQEGRLPREESS